MVLLPSWCQCPTEDKCGRDVLEAPRITTTQILRTQNSPGALGYLDVIQAPGFRGAPSHYCCSASLDLMAAVTGPLWNVNNSLIGQGSGSWGNAE